MAVVLKMSGTVEETVFSLIGQWGYKRNPGITFKFLKKVSDWKVEIENALFFWAGFKPIHDKIESGKFVIVSNETREHIELRSAVVSNLVSGVFSINAQAYHLSPNDASGQMLNPSGGVHDYFILVDGPLGLLIDFDWDS